MQSEYHTLIIDCKQPIFALHLLFLLHLAKDYGKIMKYFIDYALIILVPLIRRLSVIG